MTVTMTADLIEGRFLEDEHRRLRAGLGRLEEAIGRAHHLTRSDATDAIVRTLGWLRRDVLPHAAWEEAWLYPRLDREAATPWATRALRFEHEQVRDLGVQLETEFQEVHEHWGAELAFRLVVALTRLDTLIAAHLAQEERFVLPLLDLAEGREPTSDHPEGG